MWYNVSVGWSEDQLTYTYKVGELKAIAKWYEYIYGSYYFREPGLFEISNLFRIAEFKADFDMALSYIGRGHWEGSQAVRFKDYKRFGKAQRIVIADIIGITEYELEAYGFYQIPQLRGKAYSWMMNYLNGRIDAQS